MNEVKSKVVNRLLLLGATGAVGTQALAAVLRSNLVTHVVAPTRKKLPAHQKLSNPIVNFDQLDDAAEFWNVDATICAIGTTIKQAGSEHAFAKIDHDLVLQIAKYCKKSNAQIFALNSSLGASLTGNFYLKTKAQIEADIGNLGFTSYTIVRPSLIDTKRSESRPGEAIGLIVARTFKAIIPKKYQAVSAEAIAQALLKACTHPVDGKHIIESDQLH